MHIFCHSAAYRCGAGSEAGYQRKAVISEPPTSAGKSASRTHQAGHVGEVSVSQRGDEVVHQPELGRLPVDVWWDEEQARLGAQHRVGRQQVLAGAALRTEHVAEAGREAGQEDEPEDVHGCPSACGHKDGQKSEPTRSLLLQ